MVLKMCTVKPETTLSFVEENKEHESRMYHELSVCLCCSEASFAERLVAFAVVEGIFFSGRCASLMISMHTNPGNTDQFSTARLRLMYSNFATIPMCICFASDGGFLVHAELLKIVSCMQLLLHLLAQEAGHHAWADFLQRAHL